MARETRRQRRDARRAAGDQGGGLGRPPRLRTAEAGGDGGSGGGGGSSSFETAPVLGQRSSGPRWLGFIGESWAELKKVEWPNRSQVVQGTIVVLIACAIVGVFLYGADQGIRPLVRHVFLGQ